MTREQDRMRQTLEALLTGTDIKINGDRPWDIQVHDPRFYGRVVGGGSLALGESYMDAWWDCTALDQFIYKLLKAGINKKVITLADKMNVLLAVVFNWQNTRRAFRVGEKHYDIGNDLYVKMLDKRMVYSCAYWKNAQTLDEAQEAKLELVCKKLALEPGMTVLDIGCGWGSFAKYAAERYQVEVVGVTVSKEQVALAQELCRGLPIKILLQDYRAIQGQFDRIVSIGMFEHVGHKNYRTYFETAHRILRDQGLCLVQSMGGSRTVYKCEPWMDKYIFPNGMIPSLRQIGKATEQLFVLEDWQNLGTDYAKTLFAWRDNFTTHWPTLRETYDDRFYRMWIYYLLSCAGMMLARGLNPWQIVFSKNRSVTYHGVR
jgi:cyclopropane-fatty-acyl-phospholipid synthase